MTRTLIILSFPTGNTDSAEFYYGNGRNRIGEDYIDELKPRGRSVDEVRSEMLSRGFAENGAGFGPDAPIAEVLLVWIDSLHILTIDNGIVEEVESLRKHGAEMTSVAIRRNAHTGRGHVAMMFAFIICWLRGHEFQGCFCRRCLEPNYALINAEYKLAVTKLCTAVIGMVKEDPEKPYREANTEISTEANVGGWDMAIKDAEQEILKVKARLAFLRSALRVFKRNKADDEPWPGV